jgi:hypothetical protein
LNSSEKYRRFDQLPSMSEISARTPAGPFCFRMRATRADAPIPD